MANYCKAYSPANSSRTLPYSPASSNSTLPYSPASSTSTLPYSPANSTSTKAFSPASSTNTPTNTESKPKQPRQRLRPWLIDQINSGEVPGLEWVDRETLSFKVPWKHFGRPGINEMEDALLFRRWALHTGKFREGEKSDISTWKTRFRCALHKLPDIEEQHSHNQKEGDEPYRVYQFKRKELEVEPIPRDSTPKPDAAPVQAQEPIREPYTPLTFDESYISSPASTASTLTNSNCSAWMSPESNADADIDFYAHNGNDEDLSGMMLPELDLDNSILDSYLEKDLVRIQNEMYFSMEEDSQPSNTNSMPSNTDSMASNTMTSNGNDGTLPLPQSMEQTLDTLTSLQTVPQPHSSLSVKLYYADREVTSKVVDNQHGLRIAFNPPRPLPNDVAQADSAQFYCNIFGPFQAEQIYFRYDLLPGPPTDETTKKILTCVRRGLVLQARNGQILATRLCRAKVYYSDTISNFKDALPREQTVVVFDYAQDFLPKFKQYVLGNGPAPSYDRYFSFAEKWSPDAPLANNYVRATVTHCYAHQQFLHFQKENTECFFSGQDIFDVIAQQIDGLNV